MVACISLCESGHSNSCVQTVLYQCRLYASLDKMIHALDTFIVFHLACFNSDVLLWYYKDSSDTTDRNIFTNIYQLLIRINMVNKGNVLNLMLVYLISVRKQMPIFDPIIWTHIVFSTCSFDECINQHSWWDITLLPMIDRSLIRFKSLFGDIFIWRADSMFYIDTILLS